jgi:hypothetical protein
MKKHPNFVRSGKLLLLSFLLLLAPVIWVSCSEEITSPISEQRSTLQQDNLLTKDNPIIQAVMKVQERNTDELMKIPEVVGTAVTLTDDGKPAILVMTKTDINTKALSKNQAKVIPEKIDNYPVIVLVTGEIKAFKSSTSGVSHKAKQTPPIQLGTSGGWRYDLANGYCCGGTLGSLISKGGIQYILSNYHVLYADIVAGGNNRVATAGDPVIQPGLIDVSCNANNAQDVGKLVSGGGTLPDYNIDAGIAEVIGGMVSANGAILEVGTISANTIAASINQAVKKSGRTTGLTRSKVSGLNATVRVTYSNECAGGTAFTKTFTGQIVIANRGSKFLNSGDSGSLMVEDFSTNPRAVGLLYAGSSTSAIANPIGEVLSHYGATMVGN